MKVSEKSNGTVTTGSEKKMKSWYQKDLSKDIRYRGPLSYRHFKILGWLCIAAGQIGLILSLFNKITDTKTGGILSAQNLFTVIGSMSLVFFLIGNFAIILNDSNGYKKVFLVNGAASGGLIIAYLLMYYRYFLGVGTILFGDLHSADMQIQGMLSDSNGFFAFNLFIDLFLCTLIMFFLNYHPKKYFQGKKIRIFRSLIALPLLFELASILLKALGATHVIEVPAFCFPFLTTKPPVTFLVFLILALYLKTRERRFIRHGKTHTQYREFLKTKRNSWHFSIFASIIMALGALLDCLIVVIISVVYFSSHFEMAFDLNNEVLLNFSQTINSIGFGQSVMLLPIAPVMLLFSYTKTYKNNLIDVIIPIGGVILLILLYLEAIFRFFQYFPSVIAS